MKIDLVYLWCDDSDFEWHQKRLFYQKQIDADQQAVCPGRFVQSDELKYSLRSVYQYMPWINHIYIITDHQTPCWLNTNHPKITMINHEDIIDQKYLPLFNSSAIETAIPYITGLSEHFIYMNDDTFLNRTVAVNNFYTHDLYPIWRSTTHKQSVSPTQYEKTLLHMYNLAQKQLNFTGKPYMPHHNADAYLKSDFLECNHLFSDLIHHTKCNRFRHNTDWQRALIYYYSVFMKHGKLKIIDSYKYHIFEWIKHYLKEKGYRDSSVISLIYPNYKRKLKRQNPYFFCLEDNEKTTNSDRKRCRDFLESYFPNKSEYEKSLDKIY